METNKLLDIENSGIMELSLLKEKIHNSLLDSITKSKLLNDIEAREKYLNENTTDCNADVCDMNEINGDFE